MTDLRYADVESAVKACEQYRDSIVGIKIRMTKNLVGDNGREGLKRGASNARALSARPRGDAADVTTQ
ncbi:MAG: hypothetical protein ACKVJG_07785 [Candidatus Latescibacterota bacterium]